MKTGKARDSGRKTKKKGPNSASDVIRTKTMDEIIGVEPMVLSDDENVGTETDQSISQFVSVSKEIEQEIKQTGRSMSRTPVLCMSGQKGSTEIEQVECKI